MLAISCSPRRRLNHCAANRLEEQLRQIRIELLTCAVTSFGVKTQVVHAVSAAPAFFARGLMPYERATSANCWRSSFLPRLNLDITVPTGILSVSAISL